MTPIRLSSRSRLALPLALAASPARLIAQESTATPVASPVSGWSSDLYRTIADEAYASIVSAFRVGDEDLFSEMSPQDAGDRKYAYLWPFSAFVAGSVERARMDPTEERIADMEALLEGYERYLDPEKEPLGYDSYPVHDGGGDRFYDDNEWQGMDFVHAYNLTGDQKWLDRAVLTWEFALSGWTDDVLDGGIYWKEGDLNSKNTCSNGPAAVLAMQLYEATGDAEYLEWAERIINWLDVLYDDSVGVYSDNIRPDGSIEPTKWTYNAGTPLHAMALLYKATDDTAWLERARTLASDALEYFAGGALPDGTRVWPNTPWFNAVLHRGFVALAEVDPDLDPVYVQALPRGLAYAWDNTRDEQGLIMDDWTSPLADQLPRRLLDQGPVVEVAASAARVIGTQRG